MMTPILATVLVGIALHDPPVAEKPTSPASSTATTVPSPQPNLLAGPSVAALPERVTIVHRNFDGTLQEIDPEPDITAIGIITLSEAQRTKYNEAVAARYAAFDEIVRRNYGLILELASMQGRFDSGNAAAILEKTRTAFEPFTKRGSFFNEMKPHLDAAQVEQITGILNEYRQARVTELKSIVGENATLQQIAVRARLEAFGHMVRQSVERQVGLARESFEQFADELNLTDDQRRRAETILQPLAVKQFQRIDTAADRAEAYRQVRELLTAEQKRMLLTILIKQWTPEKSAPVETLSLPSTKPTAANPAMPN